MTTARQVRHLILASSLAVFIGTVFVSAEACDAGYYGAECDECGHCLDGALCDPTTGRCPVGCEKGYAFDNCTGYLVRNDINHTTALVTNVTTTSITVQWTSAADVPNGLENYYQFNVVVYNELFSGSHITAGEVRATSHPTEVTVSGLIARTRYTLKANIVAYGANYGSYSVILSVETLARAPVCRFGLHESCIFRCRCKDGAQCDPETGECPDGCAAGRPGAYPWHGPACQKGNVALGQTVRYVGSEGFLSVDGSVSAEIGDCVLATVATNYTYPWQVVFDQTYVIELVTIYNTNDAEAYLYLQYFAVAGKRNGNNVLTTCATEADLVQRGDHVTLSCDDDMQMDSMFVYRYSGSNAHKIVLCEVVAIGFRHIDLDCSQCYGVCDDVIGCSRCAPGKQLPDCRRDCEDGYFGESCLQQCGHCANGVICSYVTGDCPAECEPWYDSDDCRSYIEIIHLRRDILKVIGITNETITVTFPPAPNMPRGLEGYYDYVISAYKVGLAAPVDQGGVSIPATEATTAPLVATLRNLAVNTRYSVRVTVYATYSGVIRSGWSTWMRAKTLTSEPVCRFGLNDSCIFRCRCKDGAQCDPETGECPDGCAAGRPSAYPWHGPACQIGNIAFGKKVREATLVDGSTSNELSHCAASSSSYDITLDDMYVVKEVTIYNTNDPSAFLHTQQLSVKVFDFGRPGSCGSYDGQVARAGHVTVSCGADNRPADTIFIQRSGGIFIVVCEVVAIGHLYVDVDCSQCDDDCDDVIGCARCAAGKQLPDCRRDCSAGSFGVNCVGRCDGDCTDDVTCSPVTGQCPLTVYSEWGPWDACNITVCAGCAHRRVRSCINKLAPTTDCLDEVQQDLCDVNSCQQRCCPRDCADIYNVKRGQKSVSGVYEVRAPDGTSHPVLCDMLTDGGGWTVFQTREDAEIVFHDRLWDAYRDGFGTLYGSFWLGNTIIHQISALRPQTLRLEFTYTDGKKTVCVYNQFNITGEADMFSIHFGESYYDGNISDVFHKVMRNGMKFMTSDRRTGKIYSPWWYGTTSGELGANLNGIYNDELGTFLNMYWRFTKEEPALSRIEIKMRSETFINCLLELPV